MGHVFGCDAFFLEILSSPLDQLYTIHARHLKIYDDECDLVLFGFVEEARNCLSDRRPAVEEGGLVAQLELVEQDVFQSDLRENLVLENQDLASIYVDWFERDPVELKFVVHLMHFLTEDFGCDIYNEGFFTDTLINFVDKLDVTVHLMAKLPAHVEP
jgi:hypothetical protein